MQHKITDTEHIVVLEKGEEVIHTLTQYCKDNAIEYAYFRGVGAVDKLECGYYELGEKQYHFTIYDQMLEVVSMTGNVMLKDGEPFVHVHGVFTDTTNNAFGGHIKEMRVGVTLEIILTPLTSHTDRQLDDDIGLFLINCGK